MIKFDDLSIFSNGKDLYIRASILDIPLFENYYITEVYVENEYQSSIQSSWIPVKSYDIADNIKSIEEVFGKDSETALLADIENKLVFVYIKATSTNPSVDDVLICSAKTLAINATYNRCKLNTILMNSVKELNSKCDIPENFINNFLRMKALDLAICLGKFTEAQEYFDKFIKGDACTTIPEIKPCGCNGRNNI